MLRGRAVRLIQLVADYGPGQLAFAETVQRLALAAPEAQVCGTVVAPGDTLAGGLCVAALALGTPWVHLRLCLTCGHVGCCDSSPGRHARLHAHRDGHAIVQSFEPGEDWRWCFFDETYV